MRYSTGFVGKVQLIIDNDASGDAKHVKITLGELWRSMSMFDVVVIDCHVALYVASSRVNSDHSDCGMDAHVSGTSAPVTTRASWHTSVWISPGHSLRGLCPALGLTEGGARRQNY